MAENTFTVVTAHFGDYFWISNLMEKISTGSRLLDVVIIDQDRFSVDYLTGLRNEPRVVCFEENFSQIDITGHDHPSSLNQVGQLKYQTNYIILLDSDCFPVSSDWLDKIDEILLNHSSIVARSSEAYGLSHPCFMVFPASIFPFLDFSEGLHEVGLDTGRLIGLQLKRFGYSVYWDSPIKGPFGGRRGDLFLDGMIYHHGSASFVSSKASLINSQVSAPIENMFLEKIANNNFNFGIFDICRMIVFRLLTRFFRKS